MRALRVFIASPRDVGVEREHIRKVLPLLQTELDVRLDVVEWSEAPFSANESPERSIVDKLASPRDCDVVIVVVWGRLGTYLDVAEFGQKPDGSAYTGTEWEYHQALRAAADHPDGRPVIVVFRRIEAVPRPVRRGPERDEYDRQFRLIDEFFEAFRGSQGEHLRSVIEYKSIAKFRQLIRDELRKHLKHLLKSERHASTPDDAATEVAESPRPPELRLYFDHLIEGHTRLFCGREREIRAIDGFLAQHGSGYVFVEGLSGFGKTSLLAELVRGNPGFAYHFISQAYKSVGSGFDPTQLDSLLLSLCEQLRAGPVLGDKTHLGIEFKRLLQTPPAAGRRVIVLDAIDEVDRNPNYLFGLLPTRLPPGVFVILSARTQGDRCYLTNVGLEPADLGLHIRLGGLDESAVAQLLERAGGRARRQAGQPGFVRKLYDVSGGDPFYLRFLVEDVERGTVTGANIDRTPSGLSAYLDRQLSLLNRSAHMPQQRDVLGFILAAKGPLSRADLIALVDGLDGINFDDILGDIHRFLLVRNDTYTFCHDRFKNYFSAKLG